MKKSAFALVGLALVTTACSAGGDATSTTTVPVTLTTTSTTTTVPETTTTTLPETTTTTTASETTTTMTAPDDGKIELTNEGIRAGAQWIHFGYDDDDAVTHISAILGAPSKDTGWTSPWGEYGVCYGSKMRAVEWGSLVTLYTNGDTDFWTGGVEHFYAYYYTDVNNPRDLRTPEGIGIGSSLGQLRAAYDPAKIVIDEAFFDPTVGFWSYDMHTWTGLWGYATGQSDAHAITSINGGQGCGE